MKKIFKKNQIIITALALMIAIAGYLQYSGVDLNEMMAANNDISDEDLYYTEEIFTDTEDNSLSVMENEAVIEGEVPLPDTTSPEGVTPEEAPPEGAVPEEGKNPGEAVLTSSSVDSLNFAAEVKLNREQLRSKNKETLLEVINNAAITEGQKQEAVNSMIRLTDAAEREAAAEMLLEAKGFTDAVVSITDNSVDVVLDMGEITDAKRAQVEDIVKRKTNVSAENIILTPIHTGE